MNDDASQPIPSDRAEAVKVARPWGSFLQYASNEAVTVSLVMVEPEQRLSLQSHNGGAELWIVLDDGALIQVDEEVFEAQAGDELWIPAGARHRPSSGGPAARVLEVAFGNWRQDDIRCYEDDYQRPQSGE